LCHSAGVEASFRFWGWKSQAELLDFYAQADVFVMPSLVEAFGVVFLEAMASGIPVIGTRAGGIPELIEHGRNGLLSEPGDVVGLAESLLGLLADVPLQQRLRHAGLETAQSFDVERMMQCTYQVYQTVLAQSHSRGAQ
jgi:glycosyltransferase involved in cell wall biosynthesis